MKRHADSIPAQGLARGAQRSTRQPQTACDSCRQRKLKCDRAQPCASCRVRGLACSLSTPFAAFARSLSPDQGQSSHLDVAVAGILGRVAALEHAVFDRTSAGRPEQATSSSPHLHLTKPRAPPVTAGEREGRRIASFLDVAYVQPEHDSTSTSSQDVLDVRVAQSHQDWLVSRSNTSSPVWLPRHDDAIAMLHDFVENAHHLLPIVHLASARSVFDHLYSQLGVGGDVSHIRPTDISLLLAICAASALFWNEAVSSQHRFESHQAATVALGVWNKSAVEVLGRSQRLGTRSLQGAQASAILAYLAYNINGSSTQFYHLHSSSVTACRDLQIHLTDGRGYDSSQEGAATREIKRRLWWHVTAIDWMLGLNGGPLDNTYTIHPRQFKVALPRNLNDIDLVIDSDDIVYPSHIATQTSCFLQVIRLAEISRAVVDSHSPADGIAIDQVYNKRVLALDELFSSALASFPQPLDLSSPISDAAPRLLCLQRATIHLGFHSRRARLHRPFLVHRNAPGEHQREVSAAKDFQESVGICVRSARTVLDISMSLLGRSLLLQKKKKKNQLADLETSQPLQQPSLLDHDGHERCPSFPAHRLGVVVNHLFWACAILAFYSSVRTGMNPGSDSDADLHQTLINACRLLTAASEESTVAADIVRGMRNVFDKYRVRGIDQVPWSASFEQRPTSAGSEAMPPLASQVQAAALPESTWPAGALNDDSIALGDDARAAAGSDQVMLHGDAYGIGQSDLDNFFVSSYGYDGWDQIISVLDGYCDP